MELFPYQVEGARFLASKGRALLADDMGLGKSAQAIDAARNVLAGYVLVVCPASVVQNWHREIERFWPGFTDFSVVSYDYVARGGVVYRFHMSSDSTLILDEAHYLKNPKAKRTKAIFGEKCDGKGGLVEKAKHVFCLTGTPTPNNPSELWPMLRAVNGEPLSYWRFVQKFCRTRDNGFGIQIVGGKNLPELKERIAPFVLRRKKEEVLKDLPPIRFDELPLDVSLAGLPLLHIEVALIEQTLATKGVEGLREIAPHVAKLRRVTGLAKVPAAAEWITEWFEGGGGKLVVFAHHRDVIDALCKAAKPEWRACSITGSDDSATRQFVIDDFQRPGGSKLIIGQIQAAGIGVNLTAASDMLFVESSWVPADNEQAVGRINRIGQRNACLVRFATLAGSIDEQIQRAVMRKTADIAKLFS